MQYKWWVFSVTSLAILMAAIDSTVVLLAIYPIKENLNSDFVTIIWVVLAYLLVTTTFGLSLGRLGDLFGRKLMFNTGFAVFTVGSALCGLAPNGIDLVAFRGVQGFGAALVTANAFAILSEAFPPQERGKAFGANSVIWGGGSILGILLGGVIISYLSWRWIFLINIPIGIFGTYWAYRTIRPSKPREAGAPRPYFDLPAALLFTGGILSLLLGVSAGLLYGWTEWYTLLGLFLAPIFFVTFTIWEVRFSKDPILHGEFFRNPIFTSSVVASFLQSLATFSVNFLLLFYFEGVVGVTVLHAALLVVPMAIMAAIAGPIAGILSDRVGPRWLATGGLAVQATVLFLLTRLTTTTSLWDVAALEAAFGVGGGFFWPANTSTIMTSSPPGKFGVGSGIMNTFRNTGMVLSFAVSLTAITAVVPKYVVYGLFVGQGGVALDPGTAASYLNGQSFALEISLGLLLASAGLVIWKAPAQRVGATGKDWTRPASGGGGPRWGGAKPGAPEGVAAAETAAPAATGEHAPSPSYSGSPK